jgi:sugar phosphate isomerase/epimerase
MAGNHPALKGALPFRLGATSYVLPDEILPNVEYLAPLVDDVELVLFETDEYGSNLPDAALVDRLLEVASKHDLTYTVHLPLDLRLGEGGDFDDVSLVKARRVIEATRNLDPYAYTLHLDGRELLAAPAADVIADWQDRSTRALAHVCEWLDRPDLLCVENVEAWDPELFTPVLEQLPVSRVIDVGHLWLQDVDPGPHLERWLARTRIVHLHGIAARDHSSLEEVPPALLDPVADALGRRFAGVATLEVFSLADFQASMRALAGSLQRWRGGSS